MNETITDGKIHFLNDKIGYISKSFQENITFIELKKIEEEMLKEYIKYLIKYDEEKILDILTRYLSFQNSNEFNFIFRPAYIVSSLAQNALLSLKFNRIDKNDGN